MESNFSKYVRFRLSADDMYAYLTLISPFSPQEEDIFLLDDIVEYIEMMGVTKGIKKNVIQDIISLKKYDEEFCVAKGLPSKDGRDGYFEFKVNLNKNKNLGFLKDDSIDYSNIDLTPSIKKGEVIATYISKTDGEDGFDIKGNILNAKKSKDLPKLTGTGFQIIDDGKTYIASKDGKIELHENKLEISDMYTIKGDVDESTGNIFYNGDLEILGNVKSGMKVKVSGNLLVVGKVEASHLESTKAILIKGGVMGGDRAFISAGGNVLASFIERAHVISDQTVRAGSILLSYVYANKGIIVDGKKGSIVGGQLKATNIISATNIGSLSETKTEITVGLDKFLYERQVYLVNETKRIKKDIEKIDEVILILDKDLSIRNGPEIKRKLTRAKLEKLSMLSRNKLEIDEITEKISTSHDAKVEVKSYVYPGVIISVDSYKLDVEKEDKSVDFIRRGDKVLSQTLDSM